MFQWADWVETRLVNCEILYIPVALFFLLAFGFLQLRGCWVIWTMVPNIILASESKTEVCSKTKLTDNCVLDLRTVRKNERDSYGAFQFRVWEPHLHGTSAQQMSSPFTRIFCVFIYLIVFGYVRYVWMCMCGSKKTACGVTHLHPPCRSQGSHSGHQAW